MSSSNRIVAHITSDDIGGWQTALRNLVNLVGDDSVSTPPDRMQVVVNGPAVRFLLGSSPEAAKLTQMADAGVTVSACANSIVRFDHEEDDLAEGVGTIPSGVAEVVRVQKRGDVYLKLP